MSAYAAQDLVADALIYGVHHQLTAKPAQVVINADQTVTLDPGTRLVRAPARMVGGCCVGRKWPRGEDAQQVVVAAEDDYVEVVASTCASLFSVMAVINCANANALGKAQLIAVWYCVTQRPFPLGGGVDYYRIALDIVEADALKRASASIVGGVADTVLGRALWDAADAMSVGEIRRTLVNKAGSGSNAPTDSYLRLAALLQRGEPVTGY